MAGWPCRHPPRPRRRCRSGRLERQHHCCAPFIRRLPLLDLIRPSSLQKAQLFCHLLDVLEGDLAAVEPGHLPSVGLGGDHCHTAAQKMCRAAFSFHRLRSELKASLSRTATTPIAFIVPPWTVRIQVGRLIYPSSFFIYLVVFHAKNIGKVREKN